MNSVLVEHYRLPERWLNVAAACEVLQRTNNPPLSNIPYPTAHCRIAADDLSLSGASFNGSNNPEHIIYNLRHEQYATDDAPSILQSVMATLYYLARPALALPIRKHIQRAWLRKWKDLQFPRWPVDTTVDDLLANLLTDTMSAHAISSVPFIWFWPEGASSCAMMTHDVETKAGLANIPALMKIDSALDIPASFQIVPEGRYSVCADLLNAIRDRGFEINIQDLNHDGLLFRNEEEFLRRAERINWYGRKFKACGFRSAILYRRLEWFKALKFEYDMSVPNVAHLEPQRGGCCTVMPYFVDGILELPVTTTQDYSLFHILNDYSLTLWKQQVEVIRQKHGLISFITHPDYLIDKSARRVYESLLLYLVELRKNKGVWIASPGEVNDWWRQRSQLRLINDGRSWQIEGPGSERARIAYATEQNGQLAISIEAQSLSGGEQNVCAGLRSH